MEIERGNVVWLKVSANAEKIESFEVGDAKTKIRKPMVEVPAGTKFRFFRSYMAPKGGDGDPVLHFVFHTGGKYVGRRYITTTAPAMIFQDHPYEEPVTADTEE
jgi:hypothetical protein